MLLTSVINQGVKADYDPLPVYVLMDEIEFFGNLAFRDYEFEDDSDSPAWQMELDLNGDADAVRYEKAGAHRNVAHGVASARAGASVIGRASSVSSGYMSARAMGTAGLASAGAGAEFGLISASASAKAIYAGAGAEAECRLGECGAGVYAEVTVAKTEVGIKGIPVVSGIARASASGPTASGGAKVDLFNGDATVGVAAHAGEACAGPFCARVGVKFGGGLEGGIPVLHLGLFSIPIR